LGTFENALGLATILGLATPSEILDKYQNAAGRLCTFPRVSSVASIPWLAPKANNGSSSASAVQAQREFERGVPEDLKRTG